MEYPRKLKKVMRTFMCIQSGGYLLTEAGDMVEVLQDCSDSWVYGELVARQSSEANEGSHTDPTPCLRGWIPSCIFVAWPAGVTQIPNLMLAARVCVGHEDEVITLAPGADVGLVDGPLSLGSDLSLIGVKTSSNLFGWVVISSAAIGELLQKVGDVPSEKTMHDKMTLCSHNLPCTQSDTSLPTSSSPALPAGWKQEHLWQQLVHWRDISLRFVYESNILPAPFHSVFCFPFFTHP
jgi:hypothetical protein